MEETKRELLFSPVVFEIDPQGALNHRCFHRLGIQKSRVSGAISFVRLAGVE